MSNNIPKKLAIRAELVRHLETANNMYEEGKPSSGIKVALLRMDMLRLDRFGDEPNLGFYREWLDNK